MWLFLSNRVNLLPIENVRQTSSICTVSQFLPDLSTLNRSVSWRFLPTFERVQIVYANNLEHSVCVCVSVRHDRYSNKRFSFYSEFGLALDGIPHWLNSIHLLFEQILVLKWNEERSNAAFEWIFDKDKCKCTCTSNWSTRTPSIIVRSSVDHATFQQLLFDITVLYTSARCDRVFVLKRHWIRIVK